MKSLALEHLSLIASAPDGVKKLRKLILQLAVMGKLVPQDPNEEPAHVLLKRISNIKQSSFPVSNNSAVSSLDREKIVGFKIPLNWVWTNLDEIAIVNPRNELHDYNDYVIASFVPMNLIGTTFSGEHEQQLRPWKEIKQGFTHFADGDIGIAKITPCFENGKSCVFRNLSNGVGAGTTELHIIRTFDRTVDSRFVLAYLQSPNFLELGKGLMTGTAGHKRIPKDFVKFNPFPLPPLAEQHRIVAKVDELMALCDKLEAQQNDSEAAHSLLVKTLLDTLTQTQDADDFATSWALIRENFHILFDTEESVEVLKQNILQLAVMGKLVPQVRNDEPAKILLKRIQQERLSKRGETKSDRKSAESTEVDFLLPSLWEWVILEQLCEDVHYGYTASADYSLQNIKMLRITDIQNDQVDWSKVPGCSISQEKLKNYSLQNGDILIARTGGTIGKSYLVEGLNCTAVFASYLIRLKKLDSSFPQYIKIFLGTKTYWDQLQSKSMGTGQPNVNATALKSLQIPLPPLAEQHRIAAKVNELMAICSKLTTAIQHSSILQEQVSSSLLQNAKENAPT